MFISLRFAVIPQPFALCPLLFTRLAVFFARPNTFPGVFIMKIRESLRVVGLVAVLALVCASLSQWSSGVHAQKQEKARSAHPISTKTETKTSTPAGPINA